MTGADRTIPSEHRDFVDWHRERRHFAVWALVPDAASHAAVERRLDRVRAALAPLLLGGYARQPHVTVQVCGFPVAEPREAEDFGRGGFRAQAEAIAACAGGPVELPTGRATSVTSAAWVEVGDPDGRLDRLRRALNRAAPGFDTTPYAAHLTAGLYRGCWPMHAIAARLAPLQALASLRLRCDALHWMVYESARIAGPLHTLASVDLRSGRLRIADREAFDAVFGRGAR